MADLVVTAAVSSCTLPLVVQCAGGFLLQDLCWNVLEYVLMEGAVLLWILSHV